MILPDTTTKLEPPCKLSALAWYTGAEVDFNPNCFELHGNDTAIRILLDLLIKGDVSFYKQFPYRLRIRCEMANELQEFVAGKKSGKVNKIMKQFNCNIVFEKYSDYNFLIDIMGPALQEILDGYKALVEEFPAELYWYVPEEYHKRIIGVQGKTIQRIMKHYSVYVKFFNALEFAAAGGDAKTEDNVLARTPAKNQGALDDCRKAVLEMVFQNVRRFWFLLLISRIRIISQKPSRSRRYIMLSCKASANLSFKTLERIRVRQLDFRSPIRLLKQLLSQLHLHESKTLLELYSTLFRSHSILSGMIPSYHLSSSPQISITPSRITSKWCTISS
jgi:hypothetical protein